MLFTDLQLIEPILRAVAAEGYDTPTPIQQQAIPHVLAGRDLLGCAQTGTGKTAAFALPMLQRLSASAPPANVRHRPIRALILTPTRELASQIGESFDVYGRNLRVRNAVIFGGVGQLAQERAIAAGPDVVIATPGRLLDLAQQGKVSFRDLEIFVLDEADRMLDMGFIHDVRRVISLIPERRQTLFFSATMPPDIIALSARILVDPVKVTVTPIASTVEKVEQRVHFVARGDKRALLEHVLRDPAISRVLVFTRTKHGANRVAGQLDKAGIGAEAIHGNKSQNARERALEGFKQGTTRVLVATDIAARGIDVDGVTHVINFDLPEVPEQYVHRIGRTARAGASGAAVSFCDGDEVGMLTAIERLIRMRLTVSADHPLCSPRPLGPSPDGGDAPRGGGGGRQHQHGRGQQPSRRGPRPEQASRGQHQQPPRAQQQGAPRQQSAQPAPGPRPAGEGSPAPSAGPHRAGPRRGFAAKSTRRYASY